jgi:hypothetical protein
MVSTIKSAIAVLDKRVAKRRPALMNQGAEPR